MKLERLNAATVAAAAAFAALVGHSHDPNLSTPLSDGGDHIDPAICVAPILHHCSRPVHSQPLYQLSYRGIAGIVLLWALIG